MLPTPTIVKKIKGRDGFWCFIRQLGSSQGRFYGIREIQVRDLEIDDEDVLEWFMRRAFFHSALPNLQRAVLYMDGLEVGFFLIPLRYIIHVD